MEKSNTLLIECHNSKNIPQIAVEVPELERSYRETEAPCSSVRVPEQKPLVKVQPQLQWRFQHF